MVTAKKSTKKTAAKKPPVKNKTTVRSTTTKQKRAPRKKQAAMSSFHRAENTESFMSFKVTVQTVYWLLIGLLVILLAMWVLKLQNDINNIYDQIDESNRQSEMLDQKELQITREKHAQQ